jgi:alkanesulfonate monooxygenase SsuD/methylene tetrahydromethanopterin reductase-like flavin-dependent oxidoreductase (luciferase family)
MLAKEAATLDVLSCGCLELGLGAGWMKPEYERVGIPFERAGVRIGRMEEAIQIVKGLFADGPSISQANTTRLRASRVFLSLCSRPHPPLHIVGGGQYLLSIAAKEADIVGFIPRARADGQGQDLMDATPEALEQKITWVC